MKVGDLYDRITGAPINSIEIYDDARRTLQGEYDYDDENIFLQEWGLIKVVDWEYSIKYNELTIYV